MLQGELRRRGDVVLRTCHVLELATKLFLVVQNACGSPPHVNVAPESVSQPRAAGPDPRPGSSRTVSAGSR